MRDVPALFDIILARTLRGAVSPVASPGAIAEHRVLERMFDVK